MEVGRGRRPGDPLGARFLDSPLPPPHYIVIIIIIMIVIVIVIIIIITNAPFNLRICNQ